MVVARAKEWRAALRQSVMKNKWSLWTAYWIGIWTGNRCTPMLHYTVLTDWPTNDIVAYHSVGAGNRSTAGIWRLGQGRQR